jgi:olefin beta-lactone synthetase
MTISLATRLQQNAEGFPDKPVFTYSSGKSDWETVTYQQLAERADSFALGLSALGIQPGTRAALMVPPGIDFFALVFAVLRCGIVPVIADPIMGLKNVTRCLAEAAPRIYLGTPLTHAIRILFGWGRESLEWKLTLTQIVRARAKASPPATMWTNPQSEAAIIYTSGSTGLPKGAIYTAENFSAQIEILSKALKLHGNEIDLPASPLFAIIDCLLGVTAVVPDMHFPSPAKVDPAKMIAAIQTYNVNTMFVSPAALARVARWGTERGIKLETLKKVLTAGAPAPVDVQEQFVRLLPPDGELFGIYGATEALPVSIVNSREILSETRYLTAQGAGVCIGRPVRGMQVKILPLRDESIPFAEALPAGEIGEIAVRGPAVSKRYVEREGNNRLAKIRAEDGEIIHRMGDIGYFDDKGRLWYCGRKSQRVKTPDGMLFTEPVEGIFNAHPAVYRSALVGVEKSGTKEAWLWVELNPNARNVDQKRLRMELLNLAACHEMTRSIKNILFHPAFPTDGRHNSKIIREKLAREAEQR